MAPRDGSNVYTQPFPNVVADTTIESAVYNGFTNDVAIDLNAPRPITAGGTGANNARDAMINLSGEIAKQVVTNYDMQPFVAGSFYSLGSATAGPVDSHAFTGICYLKDDNNIVLEARDQGDVTTPGRRYVREKKAGVWGAWKQDGVVIGDDGSITLPATPPVNPTDAANKAYVDDNFLALAGGAMTGGLTTPGLFVPGDATITGTFNCGPVVSNGTSFFIDHALVAGATQPCFAVHNTVAHISMGFWVDPSPPAMNFGNTDANAVPFALKMQLHQDNGLIIFSNAFKPGGGPWTASSDSRIKNVLGDYTSSLDMVTALRPVRYTYKGNDSTSADGESMHRDAAAAGTEFIGLVAQEAETAMPELVSRVDGYIDGSAVADLRNVDTTPLVFALINSIKELKARVEALEAG